MAEWVNEPMGSMKCSWYQIWANTQGGRKTQLSIGASLSLWIQTLWQTGATWLSSSYESGGFQGWVSIRSVGFFLTGQQKKVKNITSQGQWLMDLNDSAALSGYWCIREASKVAETQPQAKKRQKKYFPSFYYQRPWVRERTFSYWGGLWECPHAMEWSSIGKTAFMEGGSVRIGLFTDLSIN